MSWYFLYLGLGSTVGNCPYSFVSGGLELMYHQLLACSVNSSRLFLFCWYGQNNNGCLYIISLLLSPFLEPRSSHSLSFFPSFSVSLFPSLAVLFSVCFSFSLPLSPFVCIYPSRSVSLSLTLSSSLSHFFNLPIFLIPC